MKKTLLFIAFSITALLTLLFAGCSKKDGGSGYSMKSVAGSYKLTSAKATSGGITVDAMSQFQDCELDDILQLNADSSLVYTDAGTVCNPDGSYTGKWYISGNYLIQVTSQNDTVTIKSFNGTALTVAAPFDYSGMSGTLTTTLTKQ